MSVLDREEGFGDSLWDVEWREVGVEISLRGFELCFLLLAMFGGALKHGKKTSQFSPIWYSKTKLTLNMDSPSSTARLPRH